MPAQKASPRRPGGVPPHHAGLPRILQDRVPSVGVRLVALCPLMDLVALVLDGDTIAIQCLSWQRLATLAPPPAPARSTAPAAEANLISALAWSPTGSSIAVAAMDGSVRLLHIDPSASATKPSRTAAHAQAASPQVQISTAATAVAWIPYPHTPPAAYLDRDSVGSDVASAAQSQTLVAVGDSQGYVTLFSYDLAFCIAKVEVLPERTPVSRLFFPPGALSAVVAGANSSDVSLSVVPLQPLSLAHGQVHRAGIESVAVSAIIASLRSACNALNEAWRRDGVSSIQSAIAAPLQELIVAFAESSTLCPWRLMYDAFCGGGVSGAFEHLLARKLGEAGARDALRSFSAAAGEARAALRTALPLAERFVFRASEYRGLARDTANFSAIAVSVADVSQLVVKAQETLDLLGALALQIDDTDSETCAFLRWISAAATQVAGGDPESQSSPGQRDAEEERALVAAFFQAKLEEQSGLDHVSVLCNRFSETTLPSLAKAAEALLALPTTAMTKALQKAYLSDSEGSISVPLSRAVSLPLPMSVAMRQNTNGTKFVEVAFIPDDGYVFLARHELCSGEGSLGGSVRPHIDSPQSGWSSCRIDTGASPGLVLSLSHSHVEDMFLFAVKSDGGIDGKGPFSLAGRRLFDLKFLPHKGKAVELAPPVQMEQLFDMEFCTAELDAKCILSFEADRSLASILVGSRRVVVFDLRGPSSSNEATRGNVG